MLLFILVLLLLYYFITEYNSASSFINDKTRLNKTHLDKTILNKTRLNNNTSGFANKHLSTYKDDNEFYVDKSLFMPLISENMVKERTGNPSFVVYGNYGDVPLGIYEESDLKTSRDWTRSDSVYVPNTKSLWKHI
jgi:hypothetical protein